MAFSFFSIATYAQETELEEKQKAMAFLKKNMKGCYSLYSANTEKYYSYMDSVFQHGDTLSNEQYRTAYRMALHKYPFHPELCDTLYDVESVSQAFLDSNINNAYSMWKRNSPHISFATFCNYILPYRLAHEPLSNWRERYIKQYLKTVSPYNVRQHNHYHSFSIYGILNKGFNGAVYYPTCHIPEFPLSCLLDVKLGNCESYSARSVAQLRAFGIPSTIDFTPQWGNRSMGHSWAVMFVNDTYTIPFGLNEALGMHFDERPELTLPKVYRQTFAEQAWLEDISSDINPYIPQLFRNPRYTDVTDRYVETSNITVRIQNTKWLHDVKWVYLAVFDNREWAPVAFSNIDNNANASFEKLGRGVVYIPFYYDYYGRRHYATSPFLLDRYGMIRFFDADTDKRGSVTVARKYWESETLRKYNRQLHGGRIILSNDEHFRDSVIAATVDDITENRFHTIMLHAPDKYKYLKYLSPNGSYGNIAEIEIYSDSDSIIKPVRCFGGRGAWIEHSPEKVFDGNELTSYSRISPNGAWAAAELPAPMHLSKIRIHPRTDGNAIYAGDVYRLCYWDNGKWLIAGERKAGHDDTLTFDSVPENTLLLLRNITRGKEERIFTYEKGQQVWW